MNITMLLDMVRDVDAERPLITDIGTGATMTATEIAALASAAASDLLDRERSALVYISEHGTAFTVALFAAAYAGVPVVPLNYRLAGDRLRELIAAHPDALVLGGPEVHPEAQPPDEWLRSLRGTGTSEIDAPFDEELPAVLLYTSGTTATPKAVVLRHRHLASYVFGTVELASAAADEASLVCVPPYHIAGVANVLSNLYSARRCVVLRSFDADSWLQVAADENVTHALVVPTMLARIVDALERGAPVPKTLRSIAYGGARTPPSLMRRALDAFGDVAFVQAYGLTETSSTIALLTPEDHRAAMRGEVSAIARLASVGRPIPGIEVEIRDADGAAVRPGTAGRIWLRGAHVSGEYATGSALDAGGWFDTRDRGHLDEDGYLFVEGRDDDTIIRGGENIAPAEIEEVLLRVPGVAEAVVVGLVDDEWGERLAAVLVAEPGHDLDPDAIREQVRFELRSSKTPDVLAVWSELPSTETGKVLRREVVARLLSEL